MLISWNLENKNEVVNYAFLKEKWALIYGDTLPVDRKKIIWNLKCQTLRFITGPWTKHPSGSQRWETIRLVQR